jgi:PAS domain-containing protein
MLCAVMGHSLVEEFITEDYQASVQAVLDKALDGIETANFEFPLITKAGARIEVLLNATTRRNEHGKVIGVVGIGQDITARLAQEREYSKLIDNANAPIFGVDTQGRVNVWNKCARKLVGYSLDEVMGKVRVVNFVQFSAGVVFWHLLTKLFCRTLFKSSLQTNIKPL